MGCSKLCLGLLVLGLQSQSTQAFGSFKLPQVPNIFSSGKSSDTIASAITVGRGQREKELLESISFTNNGKSATTSQQQKVIQLVGDLEASYPSDDDALTNPAKIPQLDGTWFLQYTSPSIVDDVQDSDDVADDEEEEATKLWKVSNPEENIEVQPFNAQGTVSAAGIFTVDVSNRASKQIFDLNAQPPTVFNEVELDFGKVTVGGTIRISDLAKNRAVVSFKVCKIALKIGLTLDLGFLFTLRAIASGTDESGWLETTYLSDKVRIGRGNKGSLFVLTRELDAVKS